MDNDGHADIVVVSNSLSGTCDEAGPQFGIRVFGAAQGTWVRTRRVWNEHAYHITNIDEDGTVPAAEPANWTQPGLNNFRQNKQPGGEFAAPDAIVSLQVPCGAQELIATVRNIGEASLPAGAVVAFYSGTAPNGSKLGESMTTQVLYSAQAEKVIYHPTTAPPGLADGLLPAYATVTPSAGVHECRTDNNDSLSARASGCGPK